MVFKVRFRPNRGFSLGFALQGTQKFSLGLVYGTLPERRIFATRIFCLAMPTWIRRRDRYDDLSDRARPSSVFPAEKQPTGPGPEGCVENGPAAALLVGYVSI
jgi:hypothetical protein